MKYFLFCLVLVISVIFAACSSGPSASVDFSKVQESQSVYVSGKIVVKGSTYLGPVDAQIQVLGDTSLSGTPSSLSFDTREFVNQIKGLPDDEPNAYLHQTRSVDDKSYVLRYNARKEESIWVEYDLSERVGSFIWIELNPMFYFFFSLAISDQTSLKSGEGIKGKVKVDDLVKATDNAIWEDAILSTGAEKEIFANRLDSLSSESIDYEIYIGKDGLPSRIKAEFDINYYDFFGGLGNITPGRDFNISIDYQYSQYGKVINSQQPPADLTKSKAEFEEEYLGIL